MPTSDDAAQHVGVDLAGEFDLLTGLVLDALADVLDQVLVQIDGRGHRDRQPLVLLAPQVVEDAADAEQHRHAVALGQQLQEPDQVLVRVLQHLGDAVLLLLRGEVGAEEEHLEVVAVRQRVGELTELVVDAVEVALLLGDVEQRP